MRGVYTITVNNIKVLQSRRAIKKIAAYSLRGALPKAFAAVFAVVMLSNLPGYLYNFMPAGSDDFDLPLFILNVAKILITGPLMLSLCSYFLALFRQQPAGRNELLFGFRHYGKAMFIGAALFLIREMSAVGLGYAASSITIYGTFMFMFGFILLLKYSLSYFVLSDNPEKSAVQGLASSRYLMVGNSSKLLNLVLSFVLWGLLAYMAVYFFMLVRFPDMTEAIREQVNAAAAGIAPQNPEEIIMPFVEKAFSDLPFFLFKTAASSALCTWVLMSVTCFYEIAAGNMITETESV